MRKLTSALLMTGCMSLFSIGFTAQAQESVTLTAWSTDQRYLDYFNSRLPEWEALHPNTRFTYNFEMIPNAADAYVQALSAGEPVPDLLGIEQGAFPNLMKNGLIAAEFVDLTNVIGDRRDDYAEGTWSVYIYNGRIYALPASLNASVYYYQPAIYEANELEVPATWEQALVVGEQLAAAGSAFSVVTNDGSWFQSMLNQRGGQIFNIAGEFVMGDETNRPLAIEVATHIQQGVANGTFLVVLGGDMWNGEVIPAAYREGRLAGQVMPEWWSTCCLKPSMADMAGRWAVASPPRWAGGGYGTLVWGGTGWAVTDGANAALATQFIDFMVLGLEGQVAQFEEISLFPNMIEAAADPRVTGLQDPFYNNQRLGQIYAPLAPEVPVWYQSPFRFSAGQAFADNLPQLFDGSMTPEAFVDVVIHLTQDVIDFGF